MTGNPPYQLHQPAPGPDPAPVNAVEALRNRTEVGRPASLAAAVEALLLSARPAAVLCGVSLATWHRWNAAGRCPAPVRPSPGCVRWRADELRDWIAAGCPSRAQWQTRRGNGR
jgi:predicted DNA-binding transcriptional regulator AlpA